MTIRITRNSAGNCVQFTGATQAVYWNACLRAEVSSSDKNRINIINTIGSTENETQYEFYSVLYTEFAQEDGTPFSSPTECAEYITFKANVPENPPKEYQSEEEIKINRLEGVTNFIQFNDGRTFPVNSIEAYDSGNNLISIRHKIPGGGGSDIASNIRPFNVFLAGSRVNEAASVTDIIKYLNAYFTEKTDQENSGSDLLHYDEFSVYFNTSEHSEDPGLITSPNIAVNTYDSLTGLNGYFEFSLYGGNIGSHLNSSVTFALYPTTITTSEEASTVYSLVRTNQKVLQFTMKPNSISILGGDKIIDYVIEKGFHSNPHVSDRYRFGIDNDGFTYISHYNPQSLEWQVIIRSSTDMFEGQPNETLQWKLLIDMPQSESQIDPSGFILKNIATSPK